jgi:hypothetical protein
VLLLMQVQALCSSPTWGLATTIGLGSLSDPARQFGPVRVWATFGWLAAGSVTSYILQADASPRCGMVAGGVWLVVALITFTLPPTPPPAASAGRSWTSLLGLEALQLLRHRNHGVIFISAAVVSAPLAAFYPFAAMQLRELNQANIAAAMSLGQISEIFAMYALSPLLARIRLKWILLAGIGFGVARYALFAANTIPAILAGIALHGLCFTLFYIPGQIYIDRCIARSMQARAQALLTVMVSGVGTLAGYLGCGWWREACRTPVGTNWPLYWSVLCGVLIGAFLFLATQYRSNDRVDESTVDEEL